MLSRATVFGIVRPATLMLEVSRLIDPALLVEVEADAFADSPALSKLLAELRVATGGSQGLTRWPAGRLRRPGLPQPKRRRTMLQHHQELARPGHRYDKKVLVYRGGGAEARPAPGRGGPVVQGPELLHGRLNLPAHRGEAEGVAGSQAALLVTDVRELQGP